MKPRPTLSAFSGLFSCLFHVWLLRSRRVHASTTLAVAPPSSREDGPNPGSGRHHDLGHDYRIPPQSARFKAPHAGTDPATSEQWREEDAILWKYVGERVPSVLAHTGSSAFDEHLRGVQAVLRFWNSPPHLTRAGLFHSIYGTEGFQGFSLPLSERPAIRDLIGERAEALCFVFCMVDRSTLDRTVLAWGGGGDGGAAAPARPDPPSSVYTLRARPELGRFEMNLTKEEWLDFVELTLADWLEQVEGAAAKPSPLFQWRKGEAYAYRRLAYRKMADILAVERRDRLSETPRRMWEAVMDTEPPATRHLVQERTPPVSEAAARALVALRASGEDIPDDLTPQPVQELMVPREEL